MKMVRKNVTLGFIENDAARKATYKKRVKGLIRKTQELSTLCGVDACTVVYPPNDSGPVVWPSVEPEARRILMEYKNKPDPDHTKIELDQEALLKQSVAKSKAKLTMLQMKNLEMDMENVMSDLIAGKPVSNVPHVSDLMWAMNNRLMAVERCIWRQEALYNAANPDANPEAYFASNLNNPMGNEMMGGISGTMGGIGLDSSEARVGPSNPSHY